MINTCYTYLTMSDVIVKVNVLNVNLINKHLKDV